MAEIGEPERRRVLVPELPEIQEPIPAPPVKEPVKEPEKVP